MCSPIDFRDVEASAKALVNNWQNFDSFHLMGWENHIGRMIHECISRDSSLLERSNHEIMEKRLYAIVAVDDVTSFSASHWAVGWVEGFSIRVYDRDGNITESFREFCAMQVAMGEYPILDDDHYSSLVENAVSDYMDQEGWDCNDEDAYDRACEIVKDY
jgi:hypothetical protein